MSFPQKGESRGNDKKAGLQPDHSPRARKNFWKDDTKFIHVQQKAFWLP